MEEECVFFVRYRTSSLRTILQYAWHTWRTTAFPSRLHTLQVYVFKKKSVSHPIMHIAVIYVTMCVTEWKNAFLFRWRAWRRTTYRCALSGDEFAVFTRYHYNIHYRLYKTLSFTDSIQYNNTAFASQSTHIKYNSCNWRCVLSEGKSISYPYSIVQCYVYSAHYWKHNFAFFIR